jgi:pimeloyl-ACP methyl ester carboxylesterase
MENATANIVSDAAHMVIDEQPDHVADLIESLLSN